MERPDGYQGRHMPWRCGRQPRVTAKAPKPRGAESNRAGCDCAGPTTESNPIRPNCRAELSFSSALIGGGQEDLRLSHRLDTAS